MVCVSFPLHPPAQTHTHQQRSQDLRALSHQPVLFISGTADNMCKRVREADTHTHTHTPHTTHTHTQHTHTHTHTPHTHTPHTHTHTHQYTQTLSLPHSLTHVPVLLAKC